MLVNLFASLSIIGATVVSRPLRGDRLELPGLVELAMKGSSANCPYGCILDFLLLRSRRMNDARLDKVILLLIV
jgi:hypothetical protein